MWPPAYPPESHLDDLIPTRPHADVADRRLGEVLQPIEVCARGRRQVGDDDGARRAAGMMGGMAPVMVLLMMGRERYPRGLTREAAEHIMAFSCGGLAHLVASQRARTGKSRVAKLPLRRAQRAG